MTIDDLLNKTAEELKALSDEELLKYFEPVLKVTRPELAEKPHVPTNRPVPVQQTKQFAAKIQQMKALGMDIDVTDFQKKRRKI